MQRPSAMHLPLDIYTLIGRYVRILLPLARSYNKRILVKPKICLPRESQYPDTSEHNSLYELHAARGPRQGMSTYLFFTEYCAERGSRIRDSLRYRSGHITQKPSPRLPFSTGNYGGKVYKQGGKGGAIFRRLGEKDSNICCEYGYEVWMENIKMYRT